MWPHTPQELYRNCVQGVLCCDDGELESLELTFVAVETSDLSRIGAKRRRTEERPLLAGGETKAVTGANKELYVRMLCSRFCEDHAAAIATQVGN